MPVTLFQTLVADGAAALELDDFIIEPIATAKSLAFPLAVNSAYVALLEDDL